MHSYYSNKTQPFPRLRTDLRAEVAPFSRGSLLIDHMLKTIVTTPASFTVEAIREHQRHGVRQRSSRFELRMHEMSENGQPLTGDARTSSRGQHQEVLRTTRA